MQFQRVMMNQETLNIHLHGDKPEFEFEPRTHNELIEMNKWVDLERAAKIAGSRFFFLKAT